jgi:hypothetical protein
MINFFKAAENDTSLEYLGKIFGNMGGVIPHGNIFTLFGSMFRTFNSIALTVGALIVVYITVVGVMMTAHEGEFMKKWNSLWTPIRTILGIASLVPTSSGYSGLQIVMMWVIVQGVGAADTLWNTTLGYVNYAGSPYAQMLPSRGSKSSFSALYKAVVCDETARAKNKSVLKDQDSGTYYCKSSGDDWCETPRDFDPNMAGTKYDFGPNGACGTLTLCDQEKLCQGDSSNSMECKTCQAQRSAFVNILPLMRNVATVYINADYEYQNYYVNGYLEGGARNDSVARPEWITNYCNAKNIKMKNCRGPYKMNLGFMFVNVPGGLYSPEVGEGSANDSVVKRAYWNYGVKPLLGSDWNFISVSLDYYMTAISEPLAAYLAQQISDIDNLSGQFANAQKTGWLFAGAYYYTLTQGNSKATQKAIPTFEVEAKNPSSGSRQEPNVLKGYRNNVSATRALLAAMLNYDGAGGESQAALGDAMGSVSDSLYDATKSTETNPLVQLAAAGYGLLWAAQILFTTFLVSALAIGLTSGINGFLLGTGGFNPMAVSSPIIFMILVPLLFALMGLMVTMGATMGIYVPLIPYMIFTFGAIGWFMSVIEAMVAGPLVALGILAPGGQHEILGKAEPALLLLFNVFLRPSLMIFGLIAAMLLATVAVLMINKMFGMVMYQIIGAGTGTLDTAVKGGSGANNAAMANPLELILFLVAYVGLIITALNKCFAAIHIIPERVMAWIGGQGAQYGEGEAVGEMKRGIEGGAGSASGGMKEAPGTLGSGGAEAKQQKAGTTQGPHSRKNPTGNLSNTTGGGDGKGSGGDGK